MTADIKIPYIETPLIKSANLSRIAGCNVYLKLENLQPSGSFKSRGIGHFMVQQLATLRAAGPSAPSPHFYSSSGGNAGLACVHAARTLGCRATVVVPLSTTPFMVDKLRAAGAADVVRVGASWQEADDHLTGTLMPAAAAAGDGETPVYVPPFDAQGIWDGNAGIAREAAAQLAASSQHYPNDSSGVVDAIVCSVGGGGLFAGIMQGVEGLGVDGKRTRVVAVETEGADSLHRAVRAGELVTLPGITSLATSLGARRVCARALECALAGNVVTAVLPDAEAIRACRRFADEERLVVELACGVCPAIIYTGKIRELVPGLDENSNVVIVVCGGSNMSYDIMDKYMAGLENGA
ncbi:serine family amino acid catabolism-related protein [Cordyceps fumosorosea ARSEF 2679]|uniref:L-serine ammonia-lyase n=1 Tax=Cordyceps fumosorosea (strain ARSEF 2679) TaxID=1081104 RepID=A0A162LHA2_CORFA|nr:serine family amino acid catabolism-related protein [Cordyceps fumosorosea ARSEF 2679]OAA70574.1 serine family amino acid catabolism-related protein [Cordyceps fumosorosea ARSEF 2679]